MPIRTQPYVQVVWIGSPFGAVLVAAMWNLAVVCVARVSRKTLRRCVASVGISAAWKHIVVLLAVVTIRGCYVELVRLWRLWDRVLSVTLVGGMLVDVVKYVVCRLARIIWISTGVVGNATAVGSVISVMPWRRNLRTQFVLLARCNLPHGVRYVAMI